MITLQEAIDSQLGRGQRLLEDRGDDHLRFQIVLWREIFYSLRCDLTFIGWVVTVEDTVYHNIKVEP